MFLAEEKRHRLTPQQLAIGEQLIHSSKAARDLEEFGWNKYAFHSCCLSFFSLDFHYFRAVLKRKNSCSLQVHEQ